MQQWPPDAYAVHSQQTRNLITHASTLVLWTFVRRHCRRVMWTNSTSRFELLTLESCRVMPLGCSIRLPSLNMIWLTVPELGRLQFSIDRQLKVPIFTFFGCKGGQISNLIFLTPKGTSLAETTHNDVLSVGMCPKMRPVGVAKKWKKGQKLSCVKLAICPDHPRRHRPWNFACGVVTGKFHENRSRGLRAVGGRKSPSPIDKAHGLYNSLYYRTSRD